MEKNIKFVKNTIDKLMEGTEKGTDPRKRCHSFISILDEDMKKEAIAYCGELTEGMQYEQIIKQQFATLDEDIVQDIKNQTQQQVSNGSEVQAQSNPPQNQQNQQQPQQQGQQPADSDDNLNGFVQWLAQINPNDVGRYGLDDKDHALENAYKQYTASLNQQTQNPADAQNNVNPQAGSNPGPTTSTTQANPVSTNGSAEGIMTR